MHETIGPNFPGSAGDAGSGGKSWRIQWLSGGSCISAKDTESYPIYCRWSDWQGNVGSISGDPPRTP